MASRAPVALKPGKRSDQLLVVAGDLLVARRWAAVMWLDASVKLSGKAISDTETPAITPDGALQPLVHHGVRIALGSSFDYAGARSPLMNS